MLVLGIQVLLGFTLQAFVMERFDAVPPSVRFTQLLGLVLLLVATFLVLAPVARHRIVDDGHDTPHLDAFTRVVTAAALLPFALALGAEFHLVGYRVGGHTLGIVLGGLAALSSAAAWYVLPLLLRRPKGHSKDPMSETPLNDKIRHVLTEARVVLPGTQALLGFQFVATLQQGFETLPRSSKILHVLALCFLGLSVVFLMLPAAYHRIVESGEISERLHRFSSVCIVLAMGCLAFALAGDTFVIVRKATASVEVALAVALGWLAVAIGGWFLLMVVIRVSRPRRSSTTGRSAAAAT